MSIEPGILFVVATPIGNLDDLSPRAKATLQRVDRIAAEDTRHSAHLMRQFGITTPMRALHEHNERQISEELVDKLKQGENIALISDAGTPLVSDPGYHLIKHALESGVRVSPIPGPSAMIAGLSVAGLPTDRFLFVGFLASKSGPRQKGLQELARENATLVFYETPHRIVDTLQDMVATLGGERLATIGRELTKTFETVLHGSLNELLQRVCADSDQQRGEFVVMVAGYQEEKTPGLDEETQRIARLLHEELPLKQAAALAAKITGDKKNAIYQWLLAQEK